MHWCGAGWGCGSGRRGRIVNACNPTLRKLKQRSQPAWTGLQGAVWKQKQEQANKQTKPPQSNPFSLQQAVRIEGLQEAFPFLVINPLGEVGMSASGDQTQAVKGPPWLETLLHLKLADAQAGWQRSIVASILHVSLPLSPFFLHASRIPITTVRMYKQLETRVKNTPKTRVIFLLMMP